MGGVPFLLEGQNYSCELKDKSVDFRAWMSRTFGSRFDQDVPVGPWLLILTRNNDREADRVGLQLAAHGFSYQRLNADTLPTAKLTLSTDPESVEPRLCLGQSEWGAPAVIWFRRFTADAIPTLTDDLVGSAFVRSEWDHAVRSLLSLKRVSWINRPDAVLGLDRVSQLQLAGRVDLPIPKTIVSNDPCQVEEFVASSPAGVISKVLGDHFVEPVPGELHGIFPRRVAPADLEFLHDSYLTPSIFQEYVPHVTEVRVTVIGRDVVTAELAKTSPKDLWERLGEVSVRHHDLPAQVKYKLIRYLELARLEYGAFDLLLTEDGRYVFLEVNPIGDWAWLENKNVSVRVTDKVVSYVANLLEEGERCG